ncbi:hypothetical protein G7Z17_g5077 [Cylindrodendrum hubeiense]|uniref:PARP catalytic domain-containing protein n=1 Tax=Cylindrodendrum hubeiense TaxID=595255 RepID=A0A9P5HEV0_9HYPO|nr:hypothetical protein G7Z17_g5077 [Cylindrodendrum hubeiense]
MPSMDWYGDEIRLFSFSQLALELRFSSDHRQMISCQVKDLEGRFSRRKLDALRKDVRQILHDVFSGSSIAKRFDLEVAILQALELMAEFEQEANVAAKVDKGWSAGDISDWNDVLNNPIGLDVSTINDAAFEILGKTPEELVKDIPKSWRIIHMESVLRPDLVKKFWAYKQSLGETLQSATGQLSNKLPPHSKLEGRVLTTLSRQDVIDDMVTPRITFHGTQVKSVGSIVRHGFKLPGEVIGSETIVSPRSGIVFNRGIYSSQSPSYALSYAMGESEMTTVGMLSSRRLIVCATIMGRTNRGQDGKDLIHGPLVEGYDAHFYPGFEYIVYNGCAILPCYVIHLDLGSDEAKKDLMKAQSAPWSCNQWLTSGNQNNRDNEEVPMAPGDYKREKESKKAAAMKWFPYGFGPATGTRFVIEDIGATSDDEEEYGDWQADKHAYHYDRNQGRNGGDGGYYDDWDEEGNPVRKKKGLFMDQYQDARR